MKRIMLAVCLMFGGATLVSAQEQPGQTSPQTQSQSFGQDQDGQQISVSELPDAVTAKLESQDYSGWTVGNVYKKTGDDQNEMYVVEMRQGTETKKVKFDRDGNKMDKDKKDKSSHQYRSDDASQGQDDASQRQDDASSQDDGSQTPGQSDASGLEQQ